MIFQRVYRIWILCTVVPLVGCAWDREIQVADSAAELQNQEKLPTAKLHVEMARMLGRAGEKGGAEIHYREALRLSPHSLEAQLGYARLLIASGDTQQACGWLERAHQQHPESATTCNDLGLCYAECGRMLDAVASMQRAIKLQPKEIRYRNNLARLLVAENQTEEALLALLAVHPPAVAHYNAGYLLQSHGKRVAAAAQFQKAVSLNPSLVAAQQRNLEIVRRDQLDTQTAQGPTRLPVTEIQ